MKTYIKKSVEAITEFLNELDSNELVNIHNEYCQSVNYSDDEIYNNDEEFFNVFFENRVLEAVRAVSYGEYKYTDDYIQFNGYGNLMTYNEYNVTECIDITSIADDILENEQNYNNIELEELEEEETEE